MSRASLDSAGIEGNNYSFNASLSSDGRYVAFDSWASNLVSGDTNGNWDVFRKDLQTGEIIRVSVDSSGGEVSGASLEPSVSANGRYVAFYSNDPDLVPGGNYRDVFRKDLDTGAIVRASTDSLGTPVNGDSYGPSLSQDGRYVAFESEADALLGEGGDTNLSIDVFRKDLETGAIERASTDAQGAEVSGDSGDASISSDGRYVAFESVASGLVAGDNNSAYDVFRKDLTTAEVERVSSDALGAGGNFASAQPSISAAGDFVAFRSFATNLVSGDDNGTYDIFRKDVATGAVVIVSADVLGNEGNFDSWDPFISSDARYVTFTSLAQNLVPGDGNSTYDAFRKDIWTGAVIRVSVDSSASDPDGRSYSPAMSSDGRYVAFHSKATNLVSHDNNRVGDVFVADTSLYPDTTAPSIPQNVVATPIDVDAAVVSWDASTDTGGSGLAGYRVYNTETGALVADTALTSHEFGNLVAGDHSYFVKAYDVAGNVSDRSRFASVRVPVSFAWQSVDILGSTFAANPAGATATASFIFEGDAVTINYGCGLNTGIFEVSIDGAVADTVDAYCSTPDFGTQKTYAVSPGGHKIRIRPTGNTNASSSYYWTLIDSFEVAGETYEEDDGVSYTWQTVDILGSTFSANPAGTTASSSFTYVGDYVSLNYVCAPNTGLFEVWIDGVRVEPLDPYRPVLDFNCQETYPTPPLGTHTITVRPTGNTNPSSSYYWTLIDSFEAGGSIYQAQALPGSEAEELSIPESRLSKLLQRLPKPVRERIEKRLEDAGGIGSAETMNLMLR